ncbi:hypothetical protein RESH_05000 [Rhodopirellula europaea SH398]|uniref:Uncharacterized protein n=2 Tax=Rhodopirellula TaxID=265488 RepID=M5SEN2_9BACT|nr:hypothetical protein RESH_05000 [Rhodopirellula europaea SH398]PHQ35608.1 hypothetical protein CEE69_08240 [Rhodopirellula bahusiensis]
MANGYSRFVAPGNKTAAERGKFAVDSVQALTAARVARCGLKSEDAKATDQNLIRRGSGVIENDAINPSEQRPR